MKFYVYRVSNMPNSINDPPCTCVKLAQEEYNDGTIEWYFEADSLDDAVNKLMPDSPMNEFIITKLNGRKWDLPGDWCIEIYD